MTDLRYRITNSGLHASPTITGFCPANFLRYSRFEKINGFYPFISAENLLLIADFVK
jgi:hypothetical protein